MTVIHAYRRKEPTTVELFGLSIEFKPNDKKDVVAEVDHEEALHRLLSISEAYRLYSAQPLAALSTLTTRIHDSEGVITSAGGTLMSLSRHDEASTRLVAALDARITSLDTRMTVLAAGVSSEADSTVEVPGDTGDALNANHRNTDGADQVDVQGDAQGESGVAASHYVFANEAGDSIDISKWTAKEIRDFADANEIELPKGNSVKVGELRDLLAAALAAGSKE